MNPNHPPFKSSPNAVENSELTMMLWGQHHRSYPPCRQCVETVHSILLPPTLPSEGSLSLPSDAVTIVDQALSVARMTLDDLQRRSYRNRKCNQKE